jgi:hypothetical protein
MLRSRTATQSGEIAAAAFPRVVHLPSEKTLVFVDRRSAGHI